tara:strand:- start:195 stop:389 length:195 start_codon:yes stop_codon:yes gene_type:complete
MEPTQCSHQLQALEAVGVVMVEPMEMLEVLEAAKEVLELQIKGMPEAQPKVKQVVVLVQRQQTI